MSTSIYEVLVTLRSESPSGAKQAQGTRASVGLISSLRGTEKRDDLRLPPMERTTCEESRVWI
jgi:hypothetical protein